jgi:hypothetical protein
MIGDVILEATLEVILEELREVLDIELFIIYKSF